MNSIMTMLASAGTLVFSGMAGAQTLTLQPGAPSSPDYWLGPSGQVQFNASTDLMATLDVLAAAVTSVSPAAVASSQSTTDGHYSSVKTAAPLSALAVLPDRGANFVQIMSIDSTGGLLITTQAMKSVSRGGTLSLTNMHLDLANNEVYADVEGANGVGSISQVDMWHVQSLIGPTTFRPMYAPLTCSADICPAGGPNLPITFEISGLAIHTDAFNIMVQSLGLLTLGKAALSGINDFGTLTVGPVPEASSGLMMALGLIGVAGATLSRRFPFCRHSSLA